MESGIARVPVRGFRPTFRPNLNLPIATETSAVEFYEAAVLVDTGNALCEYLGVCMHSDYNPNLTLSQCQWHCLEIRFASLRLSHLVLPLLYISILLLFY